MSTESVAQVQTDETIVRVVRSLMSWHDLAMPDIAVAIGASIGTVERRLSRKPATRKSFLGWEVHALAGYFGVPVEVFYTGAVDLLQSELKSGPGLNNRRCLTPPVGVSERDLVAA